MTLKAKKAPGGNIEDWYVEVDAMERLYLHVDGVVREGIWMSDASTSYFPKFTGLFPTKETANAAIEAYQKKEADK